MNVCNRNVYFATDARIMSFLPDILDAKKLLNWKWVTTFISSLKPQQMIFTTLNGSNKSRDEGRIPRLKEFYVEISWEYADPLKNNPI